MKARLPAGASGGVAGGPGQEIVVDAAYDSDAGRQRIVQVGAVRRHVAPSVPQQPAHFNPLTLASCHYIQQTFCKRKQHRRQGCGSPIRYVRAK